MPIKSKAQMAFMGIHHPEILRRWQKEAPRKMADLPKHVKKSKKHKTDTLASHRAAYMKSMDYHK